MKRFFPVILLTACFGAFGQQAPTTEDVHASLLTGKKRSLIAYAGQDHSFTLEVRAHTVKLSDVPGFVTIDQQIVQSTLVPVDPSFDFTHNSPAREEQQIDQPADLCIDLVFQPGHGPECPRLSCR